MQESVLSETLQVNEELLNEMNALKEAKNNLESKVTEMVAKRLKRVKIFNKKCLQQ